MKRDTNPSKLTKEEEDADASVQVWTLYFRVFVTCIKKKNLYVFIFLAVLGLAGCGLFSVVVSREGLFSLRCTVFILPWFLWSTLECL